MASRKRGASRSTAQQSQHTNRHAHAAQSTVPPPPAVLPPPARLQTRARGEISFNIDGGHMYQFDRTLYNWAVTYPAETGEWVGGGSWQGWWVGPAQLPGAAGEAAGSRCRLVGWQ